MSVSFRFYEFVTVFGTLNWNILSRSHELKSLSPPVFWSRIATCYTINHPTRVGKYTKTIENVFLASSTQNCPDTFFSARLKIWFFASLPSGLEKEKNYGVTVNFMLRRVRGRKMLPRGLLMYSCKHNGWWKFCLNNEYLPGQWLCSRV